MVEKTGQGQADKAAVEQRTAQVGAEDQRVATQGVERSTPEPTTAAAKVEQADSDDAAVLVNPYPPYGEASLDDLRAEAAARDVEINRDVERAHLVHRLRAADPTPAWDLMPLEQVRAQAGEKDIGLDPDFETAQLITELRAADTHTR